MRYAIMVVLAIVGYIANKLGPPNTGPSRMAVVPIPVVNNQLRTPELRPTPHKGRYPEPFG